MISVHWKPASDFKPICSDDPIQNCIGVSRNGRELLSKLPPITHAPPTYQGQLETANSGHTESSTAALAAVLEH